MEMWCETLGSYKDGTATPLLIADDYLLTLALDVENRGTYI